MGSARGGAGLVARINARSRVLVGRASHARAILAGGVTRRHRAPPATCAIRRRADPALARYVVGFGRPGDLGVVAEGASGGVGAAWVRRLAGEDRGYGWVDDAIPELAIAVMPESVGQGLGTRMLEPLLVAARGRYPGVSLSVRGDNPARRLYVRMGFVPVTTVINRVGGESDTMVLRF